MSTVLWTALQRDFRCFCTSRSTFSSLPSFISGTLLQKLLIYHRGDGWTTVRYTGIHSRGTKVGKPSLLWQNRKSINATTKFRVSFCGPMRKGLPNAEGRRRTAI